MPVLRKERSQLLLLLDLREAMLPPLCHQMEVLRSCQIQPQPQLLEEDQPLVTWSDSSEKSSLRAQGPRLIKWPLIL